MTISDTNLDRIVQEGFLTSVQAAQLRAAGIEDSLQLVSAWRDPIVRPRLARAVDMPVNEFMQVVFVANLLQTNAPGEVGIKILLQHKYETIPEFEDIEEQHEFVCQGRQELMQYTGGLIYQNGRLSTKYSSRPIIRIFTWVFGVAILLLLGLILYTHWDALAGNYGPDIPSQLIQILERRQALMWSGAILLLLGVEGGVYVLSTTWLMGPVTLWLSDRIFCWIGCTPRDVLVWLEAQASTPPFWGKVDQILDRLVVFIWAGPIFAGSFLPGVRNLASLILSILLFIWMMLKIIVFHVAFNATSPAWAQQARARQAGLMISKIIPITLVTLALYGIWLSTFWLASLGVQAWVQSQATTANNEAQVFLAKQTLESSTLEDLNQMIQNTTRDWTAFGKNTLEWGIGWIPIASQMVGAGLFGLVFGATFGWYIFIRRKGWIKALLWFSILYLVSSLLPDLFAVWFFQAPQSTSDTELRISISLLNLWQIMLEKAPGLTIGLFFALGQDIFENSQDPHLQYECPECHLLMPEPSCKCGRKRGFEKVLDIARLG